MVGRQFQPRQFGLALFERPAAKIDPVEIQQIEDHVDSALVLAVAKGVLQQLKVADPSIIQRHDFAIEDCLRHVSRPMASAR